MIHSLAKRLFVLALVLVSVLCMCIPVSGESREAVASFYPIYILAQNVLKDTGVDVVCMTAPTTGCLHDYQLLTSDMRTLSQAQAFIICGAGMESFVDTVTEQLPELPVIDSSEGIALLAEGAEDGMEYNAHIWLSPCNAAQMTRTMAASLAAVFPDAAEQIALNAEDYAARLEALDAELAEGLAGLEKRDIVTFHAAFSYFADAYGLHVAAILTSEPDEPVSPKALAEVVNTVREYDNPPLFAEPLYTDAALAAVHQETGAPVYYLDPLTSGDGSVDAYETVMRQNMLTLREALGGN